LHDESEGKKCSLDVYTIHTVVLCPEAKNQILSSDIRQYVWIAEVGQVHMYLVIITQPNPRILRPFLQFLGKITTLNLKFHRKRQKSQLFALNIQW